MSRPYIVGIGGTPRSGSSTQLAISFALESARLRGADTLLLCGSDLDLPAYAPGPQKIGPKAQVILAELRRADGIILGTPGYHGGISGLVKNALDTLEDLRDDTRPYLDGRAAGCIVTAYGWQAAGSVLSSLRSIVHALRGWPTPFGAGINTLETRFDGPDGCSDPKVAEQLALVGQQAAAFALAFGTQREAAQPDGAAQAGAVKLFAIAE